MDHRCDCPIDHPSHPYAADRLIRASGQRKAHAAIRERSGDLDTVPHGLKPVPKRSRKKAAAGSAEPVKPGKIRAEDPNLAANRKPLAVAATRLANAEDRTGRVRR